MRKLLNTDKFKCSVNIISLTPILFTEHSSKGHLFTPYFILFPYKTILINYPFEKNYNPISFFEARQQEFL